MAERDTAMRRPLFFAEEGVDQLVSMVLELAAELWTVRERLYVIEALSEAEGRKLSEAVESFRPTPQQEAELAAMRRRMTETLFRTLGREHRPVRDPRWQDGASAAAESGRAPEAP